MYLTLRHPSAHPGNAQHPSAVGIILAASDISGLTVLGELPDSAIHLMELPEGVTKVQAREDVMFHLAEKGGLRGDTSTYPWFATWARNIVKNPYAFLPGNKEQTYQIIGRVPPPRAQYSTIQYLRLVLKYVPGTLGTPEIRLNTMIPHSKRSIKPHLKKAVLIGSAL